MTDDNLFGMKGRKPSSKPTAASADVQRLVGLWVDLFQRKFREKPVVTPADAVALKRLVASHGALLVERRLRAYFDVVDGFTELEGYPLRLLPRSWNKLAAASAQGRTSVPGADQTAEAMRRLKGAR